MKFKTMCIGAFTAVGLAFASMTATAEDNYKVKLVAGSPGYDHIQPFIAEYLGLWKKYGVDVEFFGGNYIRANNMLSIGDFDVAYNQYANAIRYYAAGVPVIITGSSSANCALIVAGKDINSWQDLKGKRFGIVTKYDAQWMTLVKHILPRFGLSAKDIELVRAPVPEIASALRTGDVAAAFPFEPFGTNAIDKGAKLLLAAGDMIDKSKLNTDMLRNGIVMNRNFVRDHPDLAKKVMWAHMDAVEIMRNDRALGMKVLQHYNKRMDPKLIDAAYDNCGWGYQKPPKIWIETLIGWLDEDGLLKKKVTYEEMVNYSFQEGYPGYPGHKK
jgi:NitT/TauT family transport system substrate-binding protein